MDALSASSLVERVVFMKGTINSGAKHQRSSEKDYSHGHRRLAGWIDD